MTAADIAERRSLGDMALVELAKSGDEMAVRLLVQRHNQRLFRVARGVVHDDAEAEDIVQETYVKAFMALARFRGDSSLATWLTRIALNGARERLRRRKPSVELSEIEEGRAGGIGELIMFPTPNSGANPESESGRAELRRLLEQAVEDLPEMFRLVFVLRDVEGCTVAETAELLAIRPATVKTRLHRARRMLRKKLESRVSPTFTSLYPFAGRRCAGMADRVVEALGYARD